MENWQLKKAYPGIDESMLRVSVEAAVFWLKKIIAAQQGTGDGTVAVDPVPGSDLVAVDVDGVVVPVRTISAGAGLTGGGDFTTFRGDA
jgi:hypothetical protein